MKQEEPKQDKLKELYLKNNPERATIIEERVNNFIKQLKPKQETLEEAAERFYKSDNLHRDCNFIEGAKWQQERMYSEEEVLVLLHKRDAYNFKTNAKSLLDWETPKEWLEKFKK